MMAKDFSIVIATYDRPHLLSRAVETVVRAFENRAAIEIIVVDDCSTLPLPTLPSPDVVVKRMPANGGPGCARMLGLRAARAPWAVLFDDDDLMTEDALAHLSAAVKEPGAHDFLVHMFCASNGRLDPSVCVGGLEDYLLGRVRGDFTALVNVAPFLAANLSYPDSRVGGEHLLWWTVARDHGGIRFWDRCLVTVTDDAGSRLTRAQTQIANADEHHRLACATLERFGEDMRRIAPGELERISRARLAYAALAGQRAQACRAWRALGPGLAKALLFPTPYLPRSLLARLFLALRRRSAAGPTATVPLRRP